MNKNRAILARYMARLLLSLCLHEELGHPGPLNGLIPDEFHVYIKNRATLAR